MTIGVHYISRAAQIAAKEEATAGTAETLAAADVISLVGEVTVAIGSEQIEAFVTDITLSERTDFVGTQSCDISFVHYLKGSGDVDTPPDWSRFLLSSGWAEAIAAATEVAYTPDSSFAEKTLTLGAYFRRTSAGNGRRYLIKGARAASCAIVINAGEPPRVEWTWRGALVSVADAAIFADPAAWHAAGGLDTTAPVRVAGSSMTLGSWTPRFRSLRIEAIYELAPIQDTADASGLCGFEVVRRSITGSLEIKSVPVSEKNIMTDLLASTTAALALTIGTVAGNIIEIQAPAVQISNLADSNDEGLMGSAIALKFTGVDGDDELVITTR